LSALAGMCPALDRTTGLQPPAAGYSSRNSLVLAAESHPTVDVTILISGSVNAAVSA